MNLLLVLPTAMFAGFIHTLEPDHMAAVTTFVSRRPSSLHALRFGVRWGIGHSVAILVVGVLLVALELRVPETAAAGLEFGVGAMLVGLGLWLLWTLLHTRTHSHGPGSHSHAHNHVHLHDGSRTDPNSLAGGTLWVGMAHGLAGTAPLLALLPVTLLSSKSLALGYLLLFGIGTVIGMGLYALAVGAIFRYAESRVPSVGQGLRFATAISSAGLGVVWMATAFG